MTLLQWFVMCLVIAVYCWVGLLLILVTWLSCESILHNGRYNNGQVAKIFGIASPTIENTQPNTESQKTK
jgi:hypothetical protein